MKKPLLLLIPTLIAVAVTALSIVTVVCASAVHLDADMSKAVTVWKGIYTLSASWDTTNKRWNLIVSNLYIQLDESVIETIRSWSGDSVYVIIHVEGADGVWGRGTVPVCVYVTQQGRCETGMRGNAWNEGWRHVYKILISKEALLAYGGINIGFPLSPPPPVPDTQADMLKVRITKVQIAPVKLSSANNVKVTNDKEKPLFWGFMFDVKKYILIGAGIIGICIIIAAVVVRSLGR